VLTLVPYKQFTFAKLWLMFAKFEIWRLDLTVACKVLGTAIGMCHKEVWFKGYIELEVEVHKLYYYYRAPADFLFSCENLIAHGRCTGSISR
jgi:hypothetical protein